MMRGPSYDDAYISRKMSQMHGPTFAPPHGGAASYGRPPMGGYMQREEKDKKNESNTDKKTESVQKNKNRSASPTLPYFWPEYKNEYKERKKGWYRVDFGPNRTSQMWYLPTVKDRLNFLNRHKDSNPHEPFQTPSPFPVEEDDKPRSSAYWKVQREEFPSTTRDQRKSKALICIGNASLGKGMPRSSSMAPNPLKQIPRVGFLPSVGYEPMRSLSQPPTGAANYPGNVTSYWSGYPPMGPPPRMVPRMGPPPPSYYDYDYGYGYGYPGGYGYGYAPPPPRMSRYDSYLDDDLPEPTYTPRHRSRVPETADDMDMRDKAPPPHQAAMVPAHPHPSAVALRDYPPMSVDEDFDKWASQPHRHRRAHLQSVPGIEPPKHVHIPGETEGDRQLAKMQARYPSLSEPQMLQDHVDKMRIRLKSIAFSLDPSGPVPDIIVPERKKPGAEGDKKYTSGVEFNELPKLASRRQRYYPEDDYLKDNLRIKCLSHYKTTRTAADAQMPTDYWKPKQYNPDDYKVSSASSTSRYDNLAGAKWEEPDTVFGTPSSDKKPYSKPDATTEETAEERKERRKKKKSKERELAETPAIEGHADVSTSEVESAAAPEPDKEASIGDEEGLDDKERKRMEKKKRKAEREAAAKAAMEAELAALAAAEAELARLEAESSGLKTDSPAPAPIEVSSPAPADEHTPAEPATEVKSESAADKSE